MADKYLSDNKGRAFGGFAPNEFRARLQRGEK